MRTARPGRRTGRAHNADGTCRVCAFDQQNDFAASLLLARGRSYRETAKVTSLPLRAISWHWTKLTAADKAWLHRRALHVALKKDMAEIAEDSVRIPVSVISEQIAIYQGDLRNARASTDPLLEDRASKLLHLWTMAYVDAAKDVRRHFYPAGPGVQVNVNNSQTNNTAVVAVRGETALIERMLEAIGGDQEKFEKARAVLDADAPPRAIPHYLGVAGD
jgi:hypothetical protein